MFSPFGALLKLAGTCSHLEIYRRVERQSPRRFVNSADLNSTSAHSRGRFSPGPPPVPRRKVTHRGARANRIGKGMGLARQRTVHGSIICDDENARTAGFVITLIGIHLTGGVRRVDTRSCLASITETLSNKRGNIQQPVKGTRVRCYQNYGKSIPPRSLSLYI